MDGSYDVDPSKYTLDSYSTSAITMSPHSFISPPITFFSNFGNGCNLELKSTYLLGPK